MSAITDPLERQIQAYIEMSPSDIVLTREGSTSDGAGGSIGTTPTTVTVHCRVIGVRQPTRRVTSDGREVSIERALVALPGANIQVADMATVDGRLMEVVTVSDRAPWRTFAEMVSRSG